MEEIIILGRDVVEFDALPVVQIAIVRKGVCDTKPQQQIVVAEFVDERKLESCMNIYLDKFLPQHGNTVCMGQMALRRFLKYHT